MARAPSLAAPSLTPFGGSFGSFGAFNVIDSSQGPYLAFLKVEDAWSSGHATDATYLAALRTYANALPAGSSTRESVEQRIVDTTYRVERNTLVHQVTTGQKTAADLVAFDKAQLTGEDHASQDYLQKRDLYWGSQQQAFTEAEKVVVDHYQSGTLTSAQLQAWYRDQGHSYADNPNLAEAITTQVGNLDRRILDERDSQVITDYNAGKISDHDFIAYASAARGRYVTGTTQAADWDARLKTAQTSATETGLLYRYGLSQQYNQLEQFVKSNAARKIGGTSTSTSHSTRVVLGADGKWHTVTTTSTKTKAVAPTPLEVAAYKKLQIQIADAKAQMAGIVGKLGSTPQGGGFVSTSSMIGYYTGRQASLVKGSADWYAMQGKIDSLNQQLHAETVLSKEGIKITYPPVAGSPSSSPTPAAAGSAPGATPAARTPAAKSPITIGSFMASLARVESSGSYTARNAQTGAYGKYQIMPANWPAWASRYLGSASAPQTPENQEAVARAHIQAIYDKYHSWAAVAYVWHNGAGGPDPANPANYGKYVANVMGGLGVSVSPVSSAAPGAGVAPSLGKGAPAPAGSAAAPGKPVPAGVNPQQGRVGGLTVVTSVGPPSARSGSGNPNLAAASFPVNLDGAAFTKFYANYENAYKSGADSFTDNSSGRPVTYFIGNDPGDRVARMEQLDTLRIQYYQTRAQAYAGTPSEIVAAGQYNAAVKDSAAHYLEIMDTPTIGKGGASGANEPNVIASGIKLLDQTKATIALELTAAQVAYDRGDINAAWGHLQLAQNAAVPVARSGTLGRSATLADQMLASFHKAYPGLTPEEALGSSAAATFEKDFARIHDAPNEITTAINAGEKLTGTLHSQLKLDAAGNAVLDQTGQVQLSDGWARFVDPTGSVTIKQLPSTGVTPTGVTRAPKGFVQSTVQVGSTIETAYAPYTTGHVGWFKDGAGHTYPIDGKIVNLTVNGKQYQYVEDPLNPGHWNSVSPSGAGAIVYTMPPGLSSVPGPGGSSVYQFKDPNDNLLTYSLAFDPATGTYGVIGNKPAGAFGGSPVVNQAVGAAGDANVLALLASAGITRDSSSIGDGGGFVDAPFPIAGMTPDQATTWLKGPSPLPTIQNRTALDNYAKLTARTTEAPDPWETGIAGLPATQTTPKPIPNAIGGPDDRGAPAPTATPAVKPVSSGWATPLPALKPLPSAKPLSASLAANYSTQEQALLTRPKTAPAPLPAPKPATRTPAPVPRVAPLPAPRPLPPPPAPVVKPVGTSTTSRGF